MSSGRDGRKIGEDRIKHATAYARILALQCQLVYILNIRKATRSL